MKFPVFILAVLVVGLSVKVSIWAASDGEPDGEPAQKSFAGNFRFMPGLAWTNSAPNLFSNTNFLVPRSQGTNRLFQSVPPGVYKTEPYSCIVVIPGPTPDDRMVVEPRNPVQTMPIFRPELRFVPLHDK